MVLNNWILYDWIFFKDAVQINYNVFGLLEYFEIFNNTGKLNKILFWFVLANQILKFGTNQNIYVQNFTLDNNNSTNSCNDSFKFNFEIS